MQANQQALAQEIKQQILADLRQQNVGTMGNYQNVGVMGAPQGLTTNQVQAIKQDVLASLEAQEIRQDVRESVNSALTTASAYTELANNIKQDVLRELGMHQTSLMGVQPSNQALAESIKREIIAELSGQTPTYRPQQFA